MNKISNHSYFSVLTRRRWLVVLQRLAAALALVAFIHTPAYAQDKTGEIDKIFSWAKPDTPGCAVAVSQNGKLIVDRAYGSADLERNVALSPSSILDIG